MSLPRAVPAALRAAVPRTALRSAPLRVPPLALGVRAFSRSAPLGDRPSTLSYATKALRMPFLDFLLLISRIARILVGSTLAVVAVTAAVWESAHQYVEHVAMRHGEKPPSVLTPDNDAFGWRTQAALDALGSATYGTDPRLGIFGRHLVRSAWIAENWGGGVAPATIFGHTRVMRGGIEIADAVPGLALAERFLVSALRAAEARKISLPEAFELGAEPPNPTALALEAQLAHVREQLGSPTALAQACSAYEKLHDVLARVGPTDVCAAALSCRVGTLSSLLGRHEASSAWLERAVRESSGRKEADVLARPDAAALNAPQARSLVSALVALSRAHVAQSNGTDREQLTQARDVQLAGVRLARSAAPTQTAATDEAELQALWLRQKQALFAVHIAETTYALQRGKTQPSMLTRLAQQAKAALGARDPLTSGPQDLGLEAPRGARPSAPVQWLHYAEACAAEVHAALAAGSEMAPRWRSAGNDGIPPTAQRLWEDTQATLDATHALLRRLESASK